MSHSADSARLLLDLARTLGAEERRLAILGEGNVSARLGDETFLVKASGCNLGKLDESGLVECRFAPLLELLDSPDPSDEAIDVTLLASRTNPAAKKPSVEALFHADLLSFEGVAFVGHTHPIAINSILCSPRGEEFASHRIFPDEVVCCGSCSVFVPYTDPGLKLAQAIHERVGPFIEYHGVPPRVILLQNHGIITLGASVETVKAAMFMAVKAAEIFLGAVALDGPVFLADADIDRIASRSDEHHRQRELGL